MSVVNTAQSYIGKVSYVFGADNLDGGQADCSSFVQSVFRKNGINIGRTTFEQINQGTKVSRDQLQAGDLVFFQGTYATDGPSHVGIYVGNNKFIDCGSTGVRVSDLNTSYWSTHYLSATRINGSTSEVLNNDVTNTGLGSTILSKFNFYDLIQNIAVTLIIALLLIVAVIFILKAFDLDIF